MTTPTLTCDTCESEIDVATDPRCVVYDPSGATDVICEACRERAWDRWQESTLAGEWPPSDLDRLREAYRVKRGWRA
jgi:fermentation-respiration switch protein FrsA (DUF1100 family)